MLSTRRAESRKNTRRHGYFLAMLGIRQVAVLVNKMDLVGYSETVFEDIKREYADFLGKIDIKTGDIPSP